MHQINSLQRANRYFGFKMIIFAFFIFTLYIPSACTHSRNISSLPDNQNEISKAPDIQPPDNDFYEDGFLRFGDFVYQNNIKSILFSRKGWEFSSPIIELNTSETLILMFDDLDGDFKNYAYTIIHCDALWQPSEMMDYEYIEGFPEDRITEYAFSRNTRVSFTNYYLEFPNSNMQPKLSGNYILKVFIEGNPDEVVFTRRFMVFSQDITIEASVKQATNLNHRASMQEIDFTVNTSKYNISNPYRDLKVLITQNGRWDNAIYGLQPRLVQGNMLIYDYEDGNLFMGGNEFRNFDTKSIRYRSLNIESINSVSNGWEVTLLQDRSRQFLVYTSQGDINGKFLIKTDDYQDDVLEADYTWVNFSLAKDKPLVNGNVYIMGELTDWNLSTENKMEYNYPAGQYEARILLKQGFYDYQFVFLEDGKDVADVSIFEGSHSITENEYAIYIYHRRPGEVYDSLIGIHHINSVN
jgi:hypothetical protein